MAIGRRQATSEQADVTAYRKRKRKNADESSGRKRPRENDKPPKQDKQCKTARRNDIDGVGENDCSDDSFMKKIKKMERSLMKLSSKTMEVNIKREKKIASIPPTNNDKSFSFYYQTSDFDSNASFTSEKDRIREKKKGKKHERSGMKQR